MKLSGLDTDITATGELLDITDRTGGTVQIVGTPGHPVVLTSLKDDTVSGLTPEGLPQKDTRNLKGVVPPALPILTTQGPVILDLASRRRARSTAGLDGWMRCGPKSHTSGTRPRMFPPRGAKAPF